MTIRRLPSTALVILATVELFSLLLAVAAAAGWAGVSGAVDRWPEQVALLLAFAAWPMLAARVARRPLPVLRRAERSR